MRELVTLDIVDRPAGGALRTLRAAGRLNRDHVPGLRAVIPLGTARFVTRMRPAPTLRRTGILAIWDDDSRWEQVVGPLARSAREHWHVRGEVVRTAFTEPWRGWDPAPSDAAPLADDEPALVLISGDLRARFVPAFWQAGRKAFGDAFSHPGYLGGLAVNSAPLNTTSCSAWRTYADARDYAFSAGAHSKAMREDRAEGHHKTEWFTRIRPLSERGTLDGRAPFAGLLDRVAA